MTELITIKEHNGKKVINARELHEFLESRQDFSTWMKNRIEKYGFVENQDFTLFHKIVEQVSGAKHLTEYALTIDTAKEIAMVEGNEKGKKARQYFIECEKKMKDKAIDFSDPSSVLKLAENWVKEHNARILAEKQVKALQQKSDLMDKVLDCDEKIDIGQAAKILELPFGRNTMFGKLREMGVFFKNKNEPKQEYIHKGFFQLKEKFIERNSHDGFVVIKVLVTQKGLEFLSKLFDSQPDTKELATIS